VCVVCLCIQYIDDAADDDDDEEESDDDEEGGSKKKKKRKKRRDEDEDDEEAELEDDEVRVRDWRERRTDKEMMTPGEMENDSVTERCSIH